MARFLKSKYTGVVFGYSDSMAATGAYLIIETAESDPQEVAASTRPRPASVPKSRRSRKKALLPAEDPSGAAPQ